MSSSTLDQTNGGEHVTQDHGIYKDNTQTSCAWRKLLGYHMITLSRRVMLCLEAQSDPIQILAKLTAEVVELNQVLERKAELETEKTGITSSPVRQRTSFSFEFRRGPPSPLYAHTWGLLNTPIGNTGKFPENITIQRIGNFHWTVTQTSVPGLPEISEGMCSPPPDPTLGPARLLAL